MMMFRTEKKWKNFKYIYGVLTIDVFEKHTPFPLHWAFSPQLSDLTVTFNRTHCGPHNSDTTVTMYFDFFSLRNKFESQSVICSYGISKSYYTVRTYLLINWHLRLDPCHKVLPIFCHQPLMEWYQVKYLQLHHNVHVLDVLLDKLLLLLCDWE